VLIAVPDGRVVAVTDSTTFNQSPQWSADGSRLFFVSNRDGPRDIYAVPVKQAGPSRDQLTRITTGLGVQTFTFDEAGKRLAYAVYRETANVWALPIPREGGSPVSIAGAVQITFGNQVIETCRVSSDRRWLYYDSDLSGNTDIYRMPLSGGEPERLTTHPADDFAPSISTDGSELAFHSFRSGTRDVFVQPTAGGEARQLTKSAAQECCSLWSPTGSALAFHDFVPGVASTSCGETR
jgi:Tol biopolymer transport system component